RSGQNGDAVTVAVGDLLNAEAAGRREGSAKRRRQAGQDDGHVGDAARAVLRRRRRPADALRHRQSVAVLNGLGHFDAIRPAAGAEGRREDRHQEQPAHRLRERQVLLLGDEGQPARGGAGRLHRRLAASVGAARAVLHRRHLPACLRLRGRTHRRQSGHLGELIASYPGEFAGYGSTMDSLAELVTQRVGSSLGADPLVRPSDHADFQANGALAEAKRRGVPPRDLAGATAAAVVDHQLLDAADVAGPGFINLTVAAPAIWRQTRDRLADPRLGVGEPLAGERIVIDYSAPNIAKEMHVGHLRTTVIGDALARLGAFLGAEVIRQNHVGDWGTQFGMLIAYLEEHPDFGPGAGETGSAAVARLTRLYQAASAAFKSDSEFAARAHAKVVAFQSGDEAALAVWREIVEESKRYFTEVYELLGVLLTDDDVVGESFY